ncbi:MAG: STY4534 family ICE replication protein [Candidatus Thiodiazotropha endolucinida]
MSQNNPSQDDNYFNLHLTGLGYLNRVREVPVKRGSNFFAVDISAMHGKSDDVQYTRFDCRVSGKEAEAILTQIKPMIDNDENKVLVGFKLGDLYPDIFVYNKGKKEGQTGVSLKARLLRIEWVKVNGKLIEIDLPQTA